MLELIKNYEDVLSEEQINDIMQRCGYDEEDGGYFEISKFINKYAIVSYGDRYENFAVLIDNKGKFIDIVLDDKLRISDGKIEKLDDEDRGDYYLEIKHIYERKYECGFNCDGLVNKSQKPTAFFYVKVERLSNNRTEDNTDTYYVISPALKVLATFTGTNVWEGGFLGCPGDNSYTRWEFYFINERRDYMAFSQIRICDSDSYRSSYLNYIDPDACAGYDEVNYEPCEMYRYSECQLDEKTLGKVLDKYNGTLDEDDEDYDDIPHPEDIEFFYEDEENPLYEDIFSELFKPLYGIIDCSRKSAKQLCPFTRNSATVYQIIESRKENEEFEGKYRVYDYGWSEDQQDFKGEVLTCKFLNYPYTVYGLTLKYIYEFYPEYLKYLSDKEFILIPNKILDTLEDSELVREIRIKQEKNLSYEKISSMYDKIESSDYMGVVSTYQEDNLIGAVYSKGGTKHIVALMRAGRLEIDESLLYNLRDSAANEVEKKCFNILLSTLNDIKCRKTKVEQYREEERERREWQMEQELNRYEIEQGYKAAFEGNLDAEWNID